MAPVLLFEEKPIQTIVLAEICKVSLIALCGNVRNEFATELIRLPGNR